MKILLMTLAVSTFVLTGCISADEDPYPNIKVVGADAVVACKLVGHLSSSSAMPYGFFSETAHESILRLAKKEGYKLGATHIVLDAPTTGDDTVSVNGKGYVCE